MAVHVIRSRVLWFAKSWRRLSMLGWTRVDTASMRQRRHPASQRPLAALRLRIDGRHGRPKTFSCRGKRTWRPPRSTPSRVNPLPIIERNVPISRWRDWTEPARPSTAGRRAGPGLSVKARVMSPVPRRLTPGRAATAMARAVCPGRGSEPGDAPRRDARPGHGPAEASKVAAARCGAPRRDSGQPVRVRRAWSP